MNTPYPGANSTVRVLVVDDSVLMQKLMTTIVDAAAGFKVIGVAGSAEEGWDAIQALKPDLVTLDLELPGRHGLKLLARLLKEHPLPVLIVSAFGGPGADNTLQALELGAFDFIEKPDGTTHTLEGFMAHLTAALQRAALHRRPLMPARQSLAAAPARMPAAMPAPREGGRVPFVAIGASTGGVPAVQVVMRDLAHLCLPIAVVQHMPAGYTAKFAARLAGATGLDVREASDGERLKPGMAVVAPGGPRHLEIEEGRGGEFVCRLREAPLVSGHCPSVDVMFRSVAKVSGANAVGILLTGMGRDGADGLLTMRRGGAETIVQSPETCVVNGMPKAASDIGAAQRVVPLDQIGATVAALVGDRPQQRSA